MEFYRHGAEYRHFDGTLCEHAPYNCPGRFWRIDRSRTGLLSPAARLRVRRMEIWNQAKKLAEHVAERGGIFTAAEQDLWDALIATMDDVDSKLRALLRLSWRPRWESNPPYRPC